MKFKNQHFWIAAIALSFCLWRPCAGATPSVEGHWEGLMVREGAELPVSLDFVRDAAGLKGTFNSPTQRAIGLPLQNVGSSAPKVHFELVGDDVTVVFDGEVTTDALTGLFREGDAQGAFSLKRRETKPLFYRQVEVNFTNGDIILSGTLLLPLTEGQHPAMVFLHGSGPENRAVSQFLAEHLVQNGIAALIYDKRGVGKSTGDWKRSTFNDLADDAVAGVQMLRQRPEINPRKIGIYGHSQGGTIAPLVAAMSKDVAFVISGAGIGIPMWQSEVYSLTNQVSAAGFFGDDFSNATVFINQFITVARTGKGHEQLDAAVEKARGTKWFPVVEPPPKDHWFWPFYRQIADYDSTVYWSKVTVPVLLIYGERDKTVAPGPSILSIDRALKKARNGDYTMVILPRASHGFNINPEPNQPFEWWYMAPGFPDLLTAWINQRMK